MCHPPEYPPLPKAGKGISRKWRMDAQVSPARLSATIHYSSTGGNGTENCFSNNNSRIGLASHLSSLSSRDKWTRRLTLWGNTDRRPLRDSCIGLACAGRGAVLLVTGRTLTPDDRGHGTHEQLGLPPCTFYLIFKRPCPACGMTTFRAWLLRGNVGCALAANAGGGCSAGPLSAVAAPWMLISAIRGRWLIGLPGDWTFAGIAPVAARGNRRSMDMENVAAMSFEP